MFCLLHCTAWQLNPLIFHAVTDLSKVESLEESRARVDYFMALSSSVYLCALPFIKHLELCFAYYIVPHGN